MSPIRAVLSMLLVLASAGCIGIVGGSADGLPGDGVAGGAGGAGVGLAAVGGAGFEGGGPPGTGGDVTPFCGDGFCQASERCSICPDDCGPCPPGCGDGDCSGDEDCSSCPDDCGGCPPSCGDGDCNGSEDCSSCPDDCGGCPPSCGDGDCNGSEDCATCPGDCGGCSSGCGDGDCNGNEDCSSCPGDCGGVDIPADFSGVVWLHTDVSGWAQTANLSSVSVSGSQICLNYDKADDWPGVDHVGAFVNGNPWIFIRHDHQWYAATWEWLRHGQTCKNRSSVAGDHIKQDPFWNFQPRSGACYGFMVSGLARDAVRNVYERSQVRKIQWP